VKILTIALALAGLASTAPLSAQILGGLPGSQTTVNGSWTLVGRDGNGNQIYERRTQDRNGNIVVQRARRDARGNMSVISTNTVNNGNNGNYGNNRNNDCTYAQSTNSVGDIIFGRTSANTSCDDRNSRVAGGWYQVSREGNSRIYERQTTDRNGNVIIQHARRNSNGSFTVLNTRVVRNNNNRNNNSRGRGRGNNDRNNDNSYYNNAGYNNGQRNKDWQKQQKEQNKEWQKQQKEQSKDVKKDDKPDDKHDNGHGD